MTRSIGSLLLAVGMLCSACAWAQNDTGTGTSDNSAPTQPGPKPAFTYPDTSPSLDFLTGSIENSSLTLGIGTGFSYYSNTYGLTTTPNQSWWLFHVTPSIRIQQFLPKLSWHASYSGGFQTYTAQSGAGNPNNNLFSSVAGAGFIWQMARRWQLSGDDNFRHSANPFDSYLTTPGNPTANNPNPVVYTPLTSFTQNFAQMTLTNQLSKTDTLSFNGTANLRNTSTYNVVNSVPFYNLVSYGGRGSYSHQFSPRFSLGAGYDYNSLDFGRGQQRSGIQTISLTSSYVLRPNMTISGWIGPEYTSTKTVVGIPINGQVYYFAEYGSLWSTSLGATFGWRDLRNAVTASFIRSVSDGGGILATTQVNAFNASYRRMITPKLDLGINGRYAHDISITLSSRSFDNFYVTATGNYKFTKSLVATLNYSRLHQAQSSAILLGSSSYDANVVGGSLSYSWNHPLGR